jgi:crotonobetainyl-CoA:carnitine CoA-transferase CaiB-like acyl-CoA transferase
VVVENFRPDVKHRLGIGYEALSAGNPRLVYASISGFGQDGPYADRPGFDQIAQGMGGLMSITGEPGHGPMRVGIPIADLCAGIFAAQGILVALLERETSGKGQWVQSSLLQAQIFMLDFQAARWLMRGEVPPQAGNNHPTSIPTGVFRTRDGHINIAAAGHHIWERLARVLGAEAWLTDPRFATGAARSDNRDVLQVEIDARTLSDDSASWIERLNAAGVPCGPINAIDQTFAEPQVQHLGIAQELGGTKYVGQPMALSRTPSTIASPPPSRGQHTQEILRELGLSAQEVERLQARNIV